MFALATLYVMMTLTNWYRYVSTLHRELSLILTHTHTSLHSYFCADRIPVWRLWTRTTLRCGWRPSPPGCAWAYMCGHWSHLPFSRTGISLKLLNLLRAKTIKIHRSVKQVRIHCVLMQNSFFYMPRFYVSSEREINNCPSHTSECNVLKLLCCRHTHFSA